MYVGMYVYMYVYICMYICTCMYSSHTHGQSSRKCTQTWGSHGRMVAWLH